ncbi:unnamed protein product [Ectocarpus sp. CCAP 1310/34]|nr:unnamed protein product [Ectocarpus sp. CCAP 1310/34]
MREFHASSLVLCSLCGLCGCRIREGGAVSESLAPGLQIFCTVTELWSSSHD